MFAIHTGHHLGPAQTVQATCYDQGTTTASGVHVYVGEVAVIAGTLPFGTEIQLVHPRTIFGLRRFRVEDHIGWGSQMDFYNPSYNTCIQFGRQTVSYRIVARRN